MKRTFASYEHNTIGFPHIKLRWCEEESVWGTPYLTVHSIIQPGGWKWRTPNASLHLEYELGLFDDWVRKNYADRADVQG